MEQSTILFCRCVHYDSIPGGVKDFVFNALKSSQMKFESVDDLCGLAARKDGFFGQMKNKPSLNIIACSHRAVKWLFHSAGEELPDDFNVLNMMELNAETILRSIGIEEPSTSCIADRSGDSPFENAWIPWFPVIDYDRCNSCKQCLNFCLFRVFEINGDGRVAVTHPENCKTGCPACARVCPEKAIIFPKHASIQINGSDVAQEENRGENNLDSLLKGDLQDILRKRNAGVKGNFPSMDDIALAQEERKKCGCQTNSLVQIGLIPNPVNIKQSSPPSNQCNSECCPESVPPCEPNKQTDTESVNPPDRRRDAQGENCCCD